jgi:hypothetical protein
MDNFGPRRQCRAQPLQRSHWLKTPISSNVLTQTLLREAQPLVRIAPLDPCERMWPRWRLILGVRFAKAADPAHVFQTLLKCCKPAVPTASTALTVLRAPRIVLGLGGFFNPDDTGAYSQREQQRSHGTPPSVLAINAHITLSFRVCAEQTSRPNPRTDVRRRRKTTRSEHSDPTDAQPVPGRLNWHHTAHILSRNAPFTCPKP